MSNPSKPKLLLDENFDTRPYLPILNQSYDVKHVTADLHRSGLSDEEVYELAVKQGRVVVTYNYKDFRPFATKSQHSGVIGVSTNLTRAQVDTKLTALIRKTPTKSLYGAAHYVSRETRS